MKPVKTVADFAKYNEKQLKTMFISKTGIRDKDIINDAIQEFYVRLIQTKALETYDEKEGSFNTYFFNLMCWMMPQMSRNNFRYNHEVLSTVEIREPTNSCKEKDIWDVVTGYGGGCYYSEKKIPDKVLKKQLKEEGLKFNLDKKDCSSLKKNGKVVSVTHNYSSAPVYRVDPAYRISSIEYNDENKLYHDLKSFLRYAKKVESSKQYNKLVKYMKYKILGCKNVEIAKILNISITSIMNLRNRSKDMYLLWKKNNYGV